MNTSVAGNHETLTLLEHSVERALGCNVEDIRNSTLDEQRSAVERKHGRRMTFIRAFPVIGRGNIMGDRTLSREQIDCLVDAALKYL